MNTTSRILVGDCLEVMRDMEPASVDLIATDPPFNTGRDWGAYNDQWEYNADRELEYHRFDAVEQDLIDFVYRVHSPAMAAFCVFMMARIKEMNRLLKPSGSIYVHCDSTANSYIRMVLDAIFGAKNFVNDISWCYSTGGAGKTRFAQKHDTIFLYGKDAKKRFFNTPRIPYTSAMSRDPKHAHKFHADGKIMLDWWDDIHPLNPLAKERTGHPTQKPIALYERIIKASCPEDGWVLDPFAGSGTTLVAAVQLGRNAIGIDINQDSKSIIEERLRGA